MYIDHNRDTIFAPATIPGTGAISLIRVSGPDSIRTAAALVHSPEEKQDDTPEQGEHLNARIMDSEGYRIHFGLVRGKDGNVLDEVLVSVFRAPHSYTGEDSVEISCHASSYIVSEMSALLADAGLRPAEPGEFTRRAFLNGKMDLAQAEAVADVIASRSAAAHRIAISQLKGGFSAELKQMRNSLLEIVSLMELELDFSDEEVEFADRGRLSSLVDKVIAHIHRLMDSFRLGNAIRNGIPVAIAGATNVGKSTLLNALLGEERAIVSDVHGTTRDTVEETMNVGGILFRFIDTAGLRETEETVEKIGIERSYRKLHEAMVVLGIVDVTRTLEEIRDEISTILSQTDPSRQKVFIVLNKCDVSGDSSYGISSGNIVPGCGQAGSMKAVADSYHDGAETSANSGPERSNKNVFSFNNIVSYIDNKDIEVIAISAKAKTGIDTLKSMIAASQKDVAGNTEDVTVTNIRHYEALRSASSALERVRTGLATAVPTDLVAQDIREALYHLGSIVGEISTDEVLGNIFKNFCIGK